MADFKTSTSTCDTTYAGGRSSSRHFLPRSSQVTIIYTSRTQPEAVISASFERINLARRLDPFLRKAYVQGSYSYGFVERVLNTSHNQSNADFEIGYFLTRRLAVSALGIFQYTHGGIDYLYNVFPKNLTKIQFQHHDQTGPCSSI